MPAPDRPLEETGAMLDGVTPCEAVVTHSDGDWSTTVLARADELLPTRPNNGEGEVRWVRVDDVTALPLPQDRRRHAAEVCQIPTNLNRSPVLHH